jgi:hypothetical protein
VSSFKELGQNHRREAHEEDWFHETPQPVQQVGQTQDRVCDECGPGQVSIDIGDASLLIACSVTGEHEGDRYATKFEDAGNNVQVLLKGKPETPLHVPADRVDSISAHFWEHSTQCSSAGKDHHGQPVASATRDAPASCRQECPHKEQAGKKIGMLHRCSEWLPGYLEIAEELVG